MTDSVARGHRLVEAIRVARECHTGEDKQGQPFIGHPLRVMAKMTTESEMVVAVLHDVFEEQLAGKGGVTPWGYATSPDGYPLLTKDEAEALDALTRIPKEPYFSYIARVRRNALARRVKLADLSDNMDERRSAGLTASLRERYQQAKQMLEWTLSD